MSSVKYTEGLASEAARQQHRKDEYIRTLKLAAELSRKQNQAVKDAKLMGKLKIPAIKALEPFVSAEKRLADSTEQIRTAIENAKQIFRYQGDAQNFVNSLDKNAIDGHDLNEVQFFNRYFPSFSRDILKNVDKSTITPMLLKKFWERFLQQVAHFELPGTIIDFKNPAARIQFQANLVQLGDILKDKAKDYPRIVQDIDNAVHTENLAKLEEINRKLINRIPVRQEEKVDPAKLIKIDAATNEEEFNKGFAEIIEYKDVDQLKIEEANGTKIAIDHIEKLGITDTLINSLSNFIDSTYSEKSKMINSNAKFKEAFRTAVIILEMAKYSAEELLVFDDDTYALLNIQVGRKYSPGGIKGAIDSYVHEGLDTQIQRLPGTPVKHKRSLSLVGTGIPKTMHEKVIFGEILSGNNNKKLQKQAIGILRK